jgi:hypothetical protein
MRGRYETAVWSSVCLEESSENSWTPGGDDMGETFYKIGIGPSTASAYASSSTRSSAPRWSSTRSVRMTSVAKVRPRRIDGSQNRDRHNKYAAGEDEHSRSRTLRRAHASTSSGSPDWPQAGSDMGFPTRSKIRPPLIGVSASQRVAPRPRNRRETPPAAPRGTCCSKMQREIFRNLPAQYPQD